MSFRSKVPEDFPGRADDARTVGDARASVFDVGGVLFLFIFSSMLYRLVFTIFTSSLLVLQVTIIILF